MFRLLSAISYLYEKDNKYKYLVSGAENDAVITEESTLNPGALKPRNYFLSLLYTGIGSILSAKKRMKKPKEKK